MSALQPLLPREDAALNPIYSALAERFLASFPESLPGPATVGRELEFPVVADDGSAADVRRLWNILLERGDLKAKFDTGTPNLIVEATGTESSFTIEVGVGTMEVNTRPCQNLHEIGAITERAVARLVHAAARMGWRVLGYGIQPKSKPSLAIMTPKQRYQSLYRAMGAEWLWYTVTAADQTHVAITRAEAIALLNFGNIMAPVIVALCANSPVTGGVLSPYCSAREGQHAVMHANEHRHGIPESPYADAFDFVRRVSQNVELIRRADGQVIPTAQPFYRYLAQHGADYDAFLFHEHYLWNSARIRAAYGTIEVRPSCQQPWNEHMAASTLILGLICGWRAIVAYLEDAVGNDYWRILREVHPQVIRMGLAAPMPVPGFLPTIAGLAEEALRKRGFGEEVLMAPIWNRLDRGLNPAQRVARIFQTDGMNALLTHAAIRPGQVLP